MKYGSIIIFGTIFTFTIAMSVMNFEKYIYCLKINSIILLVPTLSILSINKSEIVDICFCI
jgi:hypothetical protein